MSKVSMTVDGLRDLITTAVANGTQNNWIALAMNWAEQADKEITRLQEERNKLQTQLDNLVNALLQGF